MTLLGGKIPRSRRERAADESVDLALVLKVCAVLGGAGLMLAGLFFGVRKIVRRPAEVEAPLEEEAAPAVHENLGMRPQGRVPEEGAKSAHESADLHPEKIIGIALILALVIVISLLSLGLLFRIFEQVHPNRTSEAEPVVTAAEIPPRPGVTPNPGADLLEVRAQEDFHLEHYGWIDASHTTAHIPIERAMTLWVQTYSPPGPLPAASMTSPLPPATTNGPAATTPVAPAQTELELRQQKAKEVPHVP